MTTHPAFSDPFAHGAVFLRTGCKINLFLRIGPTRKDGYHELETLFLALDEPHDLLIVKDARSAGGLIVHCDTPGINPGNNTLTRAYERFANATGFAPSLHIRLEKGVPHGAGLGGGSANAAGLLLFLRRLAVARNLPDPGDEVLARAAANVGADVPFFLENSPAYARGIGDILTRTKNPYAGKALLLLCPELVVSTAWAYQALDRKRTSEKKSKGKSLTPGLREGTTPFAHDVLPENDFEVVVLEEHPQLLQLRNALWEQGAEVALLSGTGSSVFGIFKDIQLAKKAVRRIVQNTEGLTAVRFQAVVQVMR